MFEMLDPVNVSLSPKHILFLLFVAEGPFKITSDLLFRHQKCLPFLSILVSHNVLCTWVYYVGFQKSYVDMGLPQHLSNSVQNELNP